MNLATRGPVRATAFLVVASLTLLAAPATRAEDDDLTDTLEQVGAEYGQAYISPFIHAHGANQNSALYHTAAVGGTGLHVTIGLKFMATSINEDDQTFRRVLDNVPLSDYLPPGDPNYADTGTIVMQGPTVFGNTDSEGTLTAYVDGLPVYQTPTITGLVDTRWVPLFAPQVTVGNYYGFAGTVRWFPEISLSSYGKTKFFGWGLQWGANTLLPDLPVDVMIGYFNQSLDVGTILQTDATSFFAAASKSFTMITVYGGLAVEDSQLDVTYDFGGYEGSPGSAGKIAFSVDGDQSSRITLGATLRVLGGLNVEMAHGKLTTFSAGILYGF